MKNTINFELVSPEEKLVSEPVNLAVIPGSEGEMGIGPDHASFVVNLQPGVVKLFTGNKEPRRIFIAGGFADITGSSCMVLAEQAEDVSTLNRAALEKEMKNLTEDLGMAQEDVDKKRIQKKIGLVYAKLQALSSKADH